MAWLVLHLVNGLACITSKEQEVYPNPEQIESVVI